MVPEHFVLGDKDVRAHTTALQQQHADAVEMPRRDCSSSSFVNVRITAVALRKMQLGTLDSILSTVSSILLRPTTHFQQLL